MTKTGWITAVALVAMLVIIVAALLMQVASGPTFRAEDYTSYEQCVENIPPEWAPGSLDRSGAEDACHYVHNR